MPHPSLYASSTTLLWSFAFLLSLPLTLRVKNTAGNYVYRPRGAAHTLVRYPPCERPALSKSRIAANSADDFSSSVRISSSDQNAAAAALSAFAASCLLTASTHKALSASSAKPPIPRFGLSAETISLPLSIHGSLLVSICLQLLRVKNTAGNTRLSQASQHGPPLRPASSSVRYPPCEEPSSPASCLA